MTALQLRKRDLEGDPRLRRNNFDLLRVVFAAIVMVFHVGSLSGIHGIASFTRQMPAHFAVKCFFFVSGFLVMMSFERSESLRSYAAKRLSRIFPAYAVVVLGAALGLAALSELPLGEYLSSGHLHRHLTSHLLFLNFLEPTLPGVFAENALREVNGSLWTIKIEVAFYAVVPLLLWLSRRLGRSVTLWAVFALSLLWRIGFLVAGHRTGNPMLSKLAIQIPGQLCFFVTGSMAYDRTRRGLVAPPAWAALLSVVGYAVLGRNGAIQEALAPVFVCLFCYWAAVGLPKLKLDVNRYGDISYGLYIVHWPLAQTLFALGLFERAPLFGLLAAFGGAVALSYLSWHLVESPFLRHRRAQPAKQRARGLPVLSGA